MSSLDILIKLHRFQLDEQRRHVTECETLGERLRAELKRLDEEAVEEQETARNSLEASYTFNGYACALIERRKKLMQSIEETEEQIARARAALADAFAEVKRYEIAAANRLLAKHKRLDQINQAQLDEVALTGF